MPISNPFKDLSKKQTYIAVGGFAVITGVFVYERHSKTGSWNPFNKGSNTANNATDPLTGLPVSEDNTIDPVTGQSYLAEAQQYGSVSAAEAAVSAYGQSPASGSGIPVVPASGSGGSNQGSANTVVGSSVYTSDSAWSQAAQAGLTDIGYSGTDVSAALGLYLTGQPVTSTQAQIINAAIAEYGAPPQGTFQIITAPASTPSPATGTIAVPYVVGKNLAQAISTIENAGLKEHTTTLAAYGNPSKWKVAGQNPAGGKVMPGSTITVSASKA
jgi:hypothetical protein